MGNSLQKRKISDNSGLNGKLIPKEKELTDTLNKDESLSTRKKRPFKISVDKEFRVKATKKKRAPTIVDVGGKTYVRNYTGPNQSSETIVRNNLEAFVKEIKRVVKQAQENGELNKDFPGYKNSLQEMRHLCCSEEGIDERLFNAKDGKPLKKNSAFYYAIVQFFRDFPFAMKVCKDAIKEKNMELVMGDDPRKIVNLKK